MKINDQYEFSNLIGTFIILLIKLPRLNLLQYCVAFLKEVRRNRKIYEVEISCFKIAIVLKK